MLLNMKFNFDSNQLATTKAVYNACNILQSDTELPPIKGFLVLNFLSSISFPFIDNASASLRNL